MRAALAWIWESSRRMRTTGPGWRVVHQVFKHVRGLHDEGLAARAAEQRPEAGLVFDEELGLVHEAVAGVGRDHPGCDAGARALRAGDHDHGVDGQVLEHQYPGALMPTPSCQRL